MRCVVWLNVIKPASYGDTVFYRPVIFNREADWEHEKSLYVYSVNRHINESSDAAQGMNHSETAFMGLLIEFR